MSITRLGVTIIKEDLLRSVTFSIFQGSSLQVKVLFGSQRGSPELRVMMTEEHLLSAYFSSALLF